MPRHLPRIPVHDLAPDQLAELALAPRTREAYAEGVARFARWCADHDADHLPATPETVRAYIADETRLGYARSTLRQRLAAIQYAHHRAGYPSPTEAELARLTARGAGRLLATGRGIRQAEAFSVEELRRVLAVLPGDLRGLRDRALIALMFAGALRESEAVSLDVADLRPCPGGVRLWLARSKGDRTGDGVWQIAQRDDFTDVSPDDHLRAWLTAAGIGTGPVFRALWRGNTTVRPRRLSTRAVDGIVKRAASLVVLDPAPFSGHSLRASWITAALAAGVPLADIKAHARHATVDQTLVYRRERVGVLRRTLVQPQVPAPEKPSPRG